MATSFICWIALGCEQVDEERLVARTDFGGFETF
jgi:hypothetical protein